MADYDRMVSVKGGDLAMVLTVYEEHVPPETRPFCPWYIACKEAVAGRPFEQIVNPPGELTDQSLQEFLGGGETDAMTPNEIIEDALEQAAFRGEWDHTAEALIAARQAAEIAVDALVEAGLLARGGQGEVTDNDERKPL